jgi:hypothetical protein
LEHFVVLWYNCPVLVCCTEKDLAAPNCREAEKKKKRDEIRSAFDFLQLEKKTSKRDVLKKKPAKSARARRKKPDGADPSSAHAPSAPSTKGGVATFGHLFGSTHRRKERPPLAARSPAAGRQVRAGVQKKKKKNVSPATNV